MSIASFVSFFIAWMLFDQRSESSPFLKDENGSEGLMRVLKHSPPPDADTVGRYARMTGYAGIAFGAGCAFAIASFWHSFGSG